MISHLMFHVQRTWIGDIDNLTYSGNSLSSVTDAISGEHEVDLVPRGNGNYAYYTDGSLKSDENEQISNIIYDTFLKHPKEINLIDGRWIKYYYDGAGALLKTLYSTEESWEYTGKLIYKNGIRFQISQQEGRLIYENSVWKEEFQYTDHLGNTRVSFRANGTQLEKVSDTSFDPWGVVLNGINQVNGFQNRFEYQNKEKESTFELNRINLGARTYNPTIGRMDGVDGYASKYTEVSPFQYSLNNPIRFIDINGDSAWSITNQWDKKAVEGYRKYAQDKAKQMQQNGEKCTCEDFALTVLIEYASENGLPVTISNKSGTYSSSSDSYSNMEGFKNDVLKTTAARDLQKNENTLSTLKTNVQSGDIILWSENKLFFGPVPNHIQLVTGVSTNVIRIKQGNMRSDEYTSNNPQDGAYSGTLIQSGYFSRSQGGYKNETKGTIIDANFYQNPLIQSRVWNFYQWNKQKK